jgi:hypothetical protein
LQAATGNGVPTMRKYVYPAECVILVALCIWLFALASMKIMMLVMLGATVAPLIANQKLPAGLVKIGYGRPR